jgi:dihydropteroate synthase
MGISLDDILASPRTRRAVVMGILNVTPDSFSDGGRFFDPSEALARAERMAAEGADVIDIGAESTRPGSARVTADEQRRRLAEVLPQVCRLGVLVSVDTTLASVARWALDAGAAIINDVSAGREDAGMLPLAAQRKCGLVLMHMLGEPRTMQQAPHYDDVVTEVRDFLAQRLAAAEAAGVDRRRCIVDPGIGFGKTLEHNVALLGATPTLCELGVPVLIGASRKRFIGTITGVAEPADRLAGSLAVACATYLAGATWFRVHDVAPTRQAMDVLYEVERLNTKTTKITKDTKREN